MNIADFVTGHITRRKLMYGMFQMIQISQTFRSAIIATQIILETTHVIYNRDPNTLLYVVITPKIQPCIKLHQIQCESI